ncbi:MAG: hypothetical protein JF587_06290 [Catenulisporales bacterium]|nr:hypothetical protein [Catenulisporales bacterium]
MTSTTATPQDAYALLAAIDSLDRPARMRMVARTARELAGTPKLAPLLAELSGGGTFERGLMLTMARIAGSDRVLLSMLADPDFGLRVAALGAVITSPGFDAAVLATLQDAPVAWKRAVVRAVRRARRGDLADRLLLETGAGTATDGSALLPADLLVRLLPACSEPVVAQLLPGFVHLAVDWKRLGTAHPRAVLELIGRRLDELPDGPRLAWWSRCADGVAAAAPAEPEQVLALLERHPVWRRVTFPAGLVKELGALAEHDAARTLRLLVDAAIGAGSAGHGSPLTATAAGRPWARDARMSRRVRRLLLLDAPTEALRWGRLYADDDLQTAALLKTLPPTRRDEFFDAVNASRDLGRALLADELLAVLPHRRRHREALRMLALPAVERDPFWKLRVTARLPWAEGRPVLMAQTRAADAAIRAVAYPLAITCAAAERDPAVFARFLGEDLARIRNEQDPVRQPTLKALAEASPALFDASAVAALTRLGTDTVEVRDVSAGSLTALRQLARRVLVHHAESGHDTLLRWCLRVLEQVEGTDDTVDRERLDTLRHGQERAVVDVLAPWVRRGLDRAQHRRLLSLAAALGRRAHGMPDVQAWLAETIWNSPSAVARSAIELWLADPAHRDERVAALVKWDPSVAKLWQVADVIARRRTDLLDPYLTGKLSGGRFMSENVRWFPRFPIEAPDNWLPRQSVRYAKLLEQVARDSGATVASRTDAIRRSARLGAPGKATVDRFLTSGEIQLCEAALGAVVWLPDPAAAIPTLLEHTGGDRARVAVYALTRAARYARPSQLEQGLRDILTSPTAKVTSRKEALRIAAQIGVPHLVDLLLQTWNSERQHRHVRMAAVTRLVAHLDDPRVWPALTSATAADRDVALELLRIVPLDIVVRHRSDYGKLVAELCSHPEAAVRNTARTHVAAWYPWAPQAAAAIETAVLDTASSDPLPIAGVGQLLAAGWPTDRYLDMVRQLMESAAAESDPAGATPTTTFRDRPARRCLEQLAANLTTALRATREGWRPIVAATAQLVAADPAWIYEAARLRTQALDLIAAPDVLTAELRALADLTAGRPLAAQAAAETLAARTAGTRADPIAPASFHAAASTLAADPRTSAGILAVALSAAAGPGSGWDRQWRTVVGALRAHPDADVAASALRLRMGWG